MPAPLDYIKKKRSEAIGRIIKKGYLAEKRVYVGKATCEIAAGSEDTWEVFEQAALKNPKGIYLSAKGCAGRCNLEPMVEIIEKDRTPVKYCKVSKERAQAIVERHLGKGEVIEEWTIRGDSAALPEKTITICEEPSCLKKGARELRMELQRQIEAAGLGDSVRILLSGCLGLCDQAPVFIVNPGYTIYGNVTVADLPEIVESHLKENKPVARLTVKDDHLFNRFYRIYGDVNFFGRQMRITLRNCGVIDPESIEDYLSVRGYEALARALTSMTPRQVIDEVKKSGLRGPGKRTRKNTWFAMPTKAIPAPLWTAAPLRAIRTPLSRA
jgi:(2Fe-2S) ferredoxin